MRILSILLLVPALICAGGKHALAESSDYFQAMRKGDLKALARYLKYDPKGVNGSRYGRPPLHTAANVGQLEVASWLLKNGADINLKDGDGNTALYEAANKRDPEMLNFLIKNGADVHLGNRRGETPIFNCRFRDTTRLLIKAGAKVNLVSTRAGNSPLTWALRNGRTEAALELIAAGAKLNFQDAYKCTALHHAIWGRDEVVVEALLKKRAKTNIKNKSGHNALAYAKKRKAPEIIKLLKRYQAR